MPNTFLNTNRTVKATNNPVDNVNQVSNNPINQTQTQTQTQAPVQNQMQAQQNTNAINPITIPIQIQPQISPAAPAQSNTTNVQALQTNTQQPVQNRQAVSNNAAPTPQTYNANNTSSNIVDFNQIYSSYQSQYGNANKQSNNSNSGIKKTSFGSTIVTPTASNLNSVQGQYQSAYADTINGLISEMLTQIKNGFDYNPAGDTALQMATEYAANSTLQSLAGSGVLNSSATAERVARVVSELIPQYEQLAYTRWTDGLGRLADTAQLVMQYDSQQFEYWKDAKDREFQNKQFEYQKKQDALENAWKRVDELGYVDNKASQILGVKVGTLSGEARLAKEQQEFELAKMREQLAIEKANNEALYRLRSELDKDYANYEYQLSSRNQGSSSSNNSNYERYDEIIQNRYTTPDVITGQYLPPNEEAYKELTDYLDNLYASGQISQQDFLQLSAKYSTWQQGSNTLTATNDSNTASATNNEENKNKKNIWTSGILSLFS